MQSVRNFRRVPCGSGGTAGGQSSPARRRVEAEPDGHVQAWCASGQFLQEFGQLLELDVGGSTQYFYNVTSLIDCIDPDRSGKRSTGMIIKEGLMERVRTSVCDAHRLLVDRWPQLEDVLCHPGRFIPRGFRQA